MPHAPSRAKHVAYKIPTSQYSINIVPQGSLTSVRDHLNVCAHWVKVNSVLGRLGANWEFGYHMDSAWRVFRTDHLAPVFSTWEPALAVDGKPL